MSDTYAVLVKWPEESGYSKRWLPIARGRVAGHLGVTRRPDQVWTSSAVPDCLALMRAWRDTYSESAELTLVTFTAERVSGIIGRCWKMEDDPASAALVESHWTRWAKRHTVSTG